MLIKTAKATGQGKSSSTHLIIANELNKAIKHMKRILEHYQYEEAL